MKIALIGYGKMGKAIEDVAVAAGDEISLRISSANKDLFTVENLGQADVAIEFTNPQSAVTNIKTCIDAGVPVVSGTTGWLKQWDEVKVYCAEKNGGLLYASNFSIGVNLFFGLNEYLAQIMSLHTQYDASIEETHHVHKKDAPSGTAITLAEQIMQRIQSKKEWVNQESRKAEDIQIISNRIDEVPGTHKVLYHSPDDDIEITHTAHNRKGFAAGALKAAIFLAGKKGIFSMQDVLGL